MQEHDNIYRFDVSEYYFRLTTECVRLHSNAIQGYSSLKDVIKERAPHANSASGNHPPEYIREHLRLIPTKGHIAVEVEILETNAEQINDAAKRISAAIGSSVEFADAISVIMFDFMVDANRTEVLTKLGLTSDEARSYRKILKPDAPGSKSIN
jgi:hypothetical protein